jgi:hypothetical protein
MPPNTTLHSLTTTTTTTTTPPNGTNSIGTALEDDTSSSHPDGDVDDDCLLLLLPTLTPGQIEPMRWAPNDGGDVVTPNAYVMGLLPTVRLELLAYCDRLGVTDIFRYLTSNNNDDNNDEDGSNSNSNSNALEPGGTQELTLGANDWFLQRPQSYWNSNMHWISPMDKDAHEEYLRALSAAGFDEVLQHLGDHFGFHGLAVYHVTFIAVSHCSQGYRHYDATQTNASVFNIIVPLLLANDTGPELEIQGAAKASSSSSSSDPTTTTIEEAVATVSVGRLRYRYDVACLLGDDAVHATAAVDYRHGPHTGEMRMAATIYVADISVDNIDALLTDYTQQYPPKDQPELLLAMAGNHWHRDNPEARLPVPL